MPRSSFAPGRTVHRRTFSEFSTAGRYLWKRGRDSLFTQDVNHEWSVTRK